jgi:hypothetical protein
MNFDDVVENDDAGWTGTHVTLKDGRVGVVVGVQERLGDSCLFVRLDDAEKTLVRVDDVDVPTLIWERP